VYDLSGARIQRITTPTGSWGNVDVRQAVAIGSRAFELVGAVRAGIRLYAVDPATRQLSLVTETEAAWPTTRRGPLYQ
jgi:myo-inositol-hexaphosphate 3-phosphohydrolase